MIVASRFRGSLAASAAVALLLAGGRSVAAGPSQTAGQQDLLELLRKAAIYVQDYEKQFAQVIGNEVYVQDMKDEHGLGGAPRRRLDSEVFFTRLGEGTPWLIVRNILMVNGRRVAEDSQGAIERAFAAEEMDKLQRLKALREAGARYNVGMTSRNFSDPTLALLFLGEIYRDNFKFSLEGTESIGGQSTTKVKFDEVLSPTIIMGPAGVDLPITGRLFIDASGRILRSELLVGNPKFSSSVIVTFREDPAVKMLVPRTMDERHLAIIKDPNPQVDDRQSIILCHAEYSKFRRFETSGRIVATPPR